MVIITSIITAQTPFLRQLSKKRYFWQIEGCKEFKNKGIKRAQKDRYKKQDKMI